ncbi:MAG: hypothetical protein U0821_14575 [Chloroflexota bacterium]
MSRTIADASTVSLAGQRSPVGGGWISPRLDGPFLLVVLVVALLARLPMLSLVPRFTDETLEVLHSLRIVREGLLPLTNYDSYYGSLYNYLVALAFVVSGEHPLAPRFLIMWAGCLTVAVTYFLGRDLCVAVLPVTSAIAARVVGAVAAALLAMNAVHIVVSSHVAWSNCLTPLLTTVGLWLILRGHLPLAGLTFGLALQTHPLVIAILPGAGVYALSQVVRGRAWWPAALGAGLFLVGYANVIAHNLGTGGDSLATASRIRAEYGADQSATSGYAPTLSAMLVLLVRALSGAADQRASTLWYLADPWGIAVALLAIAGVALSVRRREWLIAAAVLIFLAVMPAANPKFRTLLTARYLMPVVPALLAVAVCGGFWFWHWLRPRLGVTPVSRAWMAVVLLAGGMETGSLVRYYQRTIERTDTNERILGLADLAARTIQAGEIVLIDDSIGAELPDTGVTELRGVEYLLTVARLPYRAIRVTAGRLQDELRTAPSALAVLNARDAAQVADRLTVVALDLRPPAETGRMSDFRLYRISRARG